MLQSLSSISILSILSHTQTTQGATQTPSIDVDTDSDSIPDDVRDPFLMVNASAHAFQKSNMGWDDADEDTIISEILRLDPALINELDLTGWHGPPEDTGIYAPRHQAVQGFAHEHHLPYTNGVHWEFNPDQLYEDWYSQLPEDEKWEYPDGSVVEHPSEVLAEHFDGEPHIRGEEHQNLVPSMFADGTKDRLIRTGQELFNLGINQFWIDTPVGGLSFGFDYSVWAQTAFRNYLHSLTERELEDLGISDADEFSVIDHFSTNGIAPGDTNQPHSDPVFREFTRFQHQHKNELVSEIFKQVKSDLPSGIEESDTTVFGLGFGLQYHHLTPASIYKSDDVDVISIETQPTVPPNRPHDVTVKIGRAAGKFEKPVRVWGRMNETFGTTYGLDPTEYYETLMQFHMAQVYSHGGKRSIPLTALPNNRYEEAVNSWMRPDGTISEELHQFVDFTKAHRRFLTDVTEANRVALVVSLPTLVWQWLPDWGVHNTRHSKAIGEAAITLRREHIPYDVLILDDPPLWSDPDQLDRLAEYEYLILPGVECASDDHFEAIEAALSEGTTVIATGGVPTHDEDYVERDDIATRFEEEAEATILDSEPDISGEGESASALRDELSSIDKQVVIDTDADISINVLTQSDPDRFIVHLLNFEYDEDRDSMRELEDITLSINELPFSPEATSYYTVTGATELDVSIADSAASVTVPHLDIWGFVVFGETDDALAPVVSEAEAMEISSNAEELFGQIDEPREYPEGRIAAAKLQNIRPALDYKAYDVARELAEDAMAFTNTIIEEDTTEEGKSTTADDQVADDDQVGETDSDVPGFGATAALAGVLGAGYIFQRFRENKNE